MLAKSFTDFRSTSHFPGNVTIRTGVGDDMILMASSHEGTLDIAASDGDDVVISNSIGGLALPMGIGGDRTTLSRLSITRPTSSTPAPATTPY